MWCRPWGVQELDRNENCAVGTGSYEEKMDGALNTRRLNFLKKARPDRMFLHRGSLLSGVPDNLHPYKQEPGNEINLPRFTMNLSYRQATLHQVASLQPSNII